MPARGRVHLPRPDRPGGHHCDGGRANLRIGALLQRTAAEEELLDIGAALYSYAAATPQGQPQQPPSLQDLLKDPRFPGPRRHLRKLFVDPMTGKAEWGVMYLADKVGVIGVYSLSDAQPFKIANFGPHFLDFEHKERISEWKFTMTGQGAVLPARAAAPEAVAPPVEAQAALSGPEPAAPQEPPAAQPEEDEPVKEKTSALRLRPPQSGLAFQLRQVAHRAAIG